MQHPFDGVIDNQTPTEQVRHPQSHAAVDRGESQCSRRGLFSYTAAAVGALGSLTAGRVLGQEEDRRDTTPERESESRQSDRRPRRTETRRLSRDEDDREREEREYRESDRDRDDRWERLGDEWERRGDEWERREEAWNRREREWDRREEEWNRRREGRRREEAEWYDRLDSYFFDRNYWGPGSDRSGRGRYTTQALGEEGGGGRDRRGGWYGGRNDYDRWNDGARWGRRRRSRRRDQRRRYTTYALGEEG